MAAPKLKIEQREPRSNFADNSVTSVYKSGSDRFGTPVYDPVVNTSMNSTGGLSTTYINTRNNLISKLGDYGQKQDGLAWWKDKTPYNLVNTSNKARDFANELITTAKNSNNLNLLDQNYIKAFETGAYDVKNTVGAPRPEGYTGNVFNTTADQKDIERLLTGYEGGQFDIEKGIAGSKEYNKNIRPNITVPIYNAGFTSGQSTALYGAKQRSGSLLNISGTTNTIGRPQ